MQKTILVIDDEEDIRHLIQGLLEDEGYQTIIAENSDIAYAHIEEYRPDLIIQDIWLQGSEDDGIEILKKTKHTSPSIPFIMISGHGTIETAVSTIKLGAYDFIEKPFKSDRLLLMIHRALEASALKQQNESLKLRAKVHVDTQAKQIPETIKNMLDKIAGSNSRILITGEAGTGKNIAAQYLHEHSKRSSQPFMTFNCLNSETEKLEEELFGTPYKAGFLSLANNGTLLLDEVSNLPHSTQGKLLNVLQENAFCPIGGNIKTPIDIRFITTCSIDLEEQVKQERFREDLYYRLNVVPVQIAPLRNRKLDVADLIESYSQKKFSMDAISTLQAHNWPGNTKQLLNLLEWLDIMYAQSNSPITLEQLPSEYSGKRAYTDKKQEKEPTRFIFMDHVIPLRLRDAREFFEKHYLIEQLDKFDGNISKTANFIGMERSALHRKLKSLNIFSDDKQNVA